MEINLDWTKFKQLVTAKSLSIQYVEDTNMYYLHAFDGPFSIACRLDKSVTEEVTDFETNFKAQGNKRLAPADSDGSILQRLKVTTSGWALHYHGLEITTSKLSGVVDRNENNQENNFSTVKLYAADGSLITDVLQEGACVKTVVDWEPTFDYDIIGGDVLVVAPPLTNVRVSVIGVPDIPANMGGSKAFMTGFNLKFVSPHGIHLDGKTPKSTVYNPTLHTNKIRFVFYHDAGVQQTALVMLNIFKA